jgi:tetratricopeptide (TPR) repeat protein
MPPRPFVGPVLIVGLCLSAAACSRLIKPEPVADPGAEPTAPATDDEAQTLAADLERAVRSGDRARILQAFQLDAVAERTAAAIPVTPDQRPEILKSVPEKFESHELVNLLVAHGAKPAAFKLVRVRPLDGRHVATFRLHTDDFVPVFLDVRIARYSGGRVGVEDLFCVNTGKGISDYARQELLRAAALRDPGLDERLTADDRAYLANTPKAADLEKAIKARQWRDAMAVYDRLPTELKEQKAILVGHAYACLWAGHFDKAEAPVAAARRRFPNDPTVDLLAATYYWFRQDYQAAARILDGLRSSIGEDAVLNARQAAALTKTGPLKAAAVAAERAVEADPSLPLGYLSRLAVAMERDNHADTLTWLKRTVEGTGYNFGDLRRQADYTLFIRSPQYAEWEAWQKDRSGR